MTATTTARRAISNTASRDVTVKALPFAKGKGADSRNLAFGDVSTFAYIEGKSRADTVDTLRKALGNKPTAEQIDACRIAYIVGRVGFKLADGKRDAFDNIQFARDVVTAYAAPVKDGVAARKLRKGQKGRRTVEQHKAVRAAEEAWSQVKAEVTPALSNAKTQAERNAKKRAPSMAGSGKGKASPETLTQLATPAAPMDAAGTVEHMATQAAALLAFANKHAALLPAGIATAVRAFNASVAKDAAAFRSINA